MLNNATLAEAIAFLRLRALDLDPTQKGINLNTLGDDALDDRLIKDLKLKNVPLPAVLQYICDLSETRLHIQGRNISILPK